MGRRVISMVVVAAFVLALAALPATAGLVGYWPLDEPTGATAVDDVMSATNATVRDPSWNIIGFVSTPGVIGTAFNAGNRERLIHSQRSTSNLGISASGARSVSFWQYWLGSGTDSHTFMLGGGGADRTDWGLWYRQSGGYWRVQIWNQSGTDFTVGPVANTWQHWAMTYDPSTRQTKVYINGTLRHTHTANGALNTKDSSFVFAGQGGQYNTRGRIDDFGIYNDTLSQTEVRAIRNVGLEGDLAYGLDRLELLFDNFGTGTEVLIDGRLWTPFNATAGYTGSDGALSEYQTGQFKLFLGTNVGMISSEPPSGVVPEPAGLAVLGLAALAVRRRKRS